MLGRGTIAALATAPGRAAIAIVRLSGPDAFAALAQLGGRAIEPRRATLCRLADPATGEILDRALVLTFPAPASYTGEDMAELHVHGGRAVAASVLEALGKLGVAIAEPGEFTRRAFLHGKLDLTEVEALADLIAAETREQQRQAAEQLAGRLSATAETWRARLVRAGALLEAAIDFPDEDLPQDIALRAASLLQGVRDEIARELGNAHRGERLREGLTVALVGPVNSGKSTLLNALARREVAIVSEHAGTTRDVLEVFLDLGGFPVTLIDTAGLRDVADPVEAEGVRRARERAGRADVRLATFPCGGGVEWRALGIVPTTDDILIRTISDLAPVGPPVPGWPGGASLAVSAKSGEGLDALVAAIADRARKLMSAEDRPLVTRARHRQELERALAAIGRALAAPAGSPELAAEDIRSASHALSRLVGRVDVEDLLDVIFGEFCIGK